MNLAPSVMGPFVPPWKRAIDVICCLIALPILGIASLFMMAWCAIASRGPIFYLQERIGYRGRKFKFYKFRTMHVKADTGNHRAHFAELVRSKVPMQKMDERGDSRLVPFGALIRASGLDELPQIINVLRGEMSVVGPRPCIAYEYEEYSESQRERFDCVPGLTGLWQVSGKNRTTFQEMVQLDIDYSRRKSFWLDLKIILMTVPALCGQMFDLWRAKAAMHARESSQRKYPPMQLAQSGRK